jgi:transcriptional regulator with XRE-family HTH domain
MGRPGRPRATAANRFVGMRIRERRTLLGLSMPRLADMVGVTYQQLNKYETGINNVYVGRLYDIARELSVPIEYFFEGLEEDGRRLAPHNELLLDTMRSLWKVQNKKHLEAIRQLVRALAGC